MADAELPAFTDPARCAKCGCEVVATFYERPRRFKLPHGEEVELEPEKLRRTCGRCRFTWDEACVRAAG